MNISSVNLKHIPQILQLEQNLFDDNGFELKELIDILKNKNCGGFIAKDQNHIIGCILFELHEWGIEIITIDVEKKYQRQKIGSQFINKLIDLVKEYKIKTCLAMVKETNLQAQLFFKSLQFKYVKTLKNHFKNSADEAYVFRWRLK